MEITAWRGLAILVLLVLGVVLAGCTGNSGTSGGQALPAASHSPSTSPAAPVTGLPLLESDASIIDANNKFSSDLYRQLAANPASSGSNIFFSPFSISSALAITYEGARGKTADEIRSVFYFPVNETVRRQGFSRINGYLNQHDSGYTLSTANALWAEKSYAFLPEYISTAGTYYSANTTNLDFISQPEVSRITINHWVEERTANKIRDLLPADSIDPLTRLVITNAVYFKGTWMKQFDANKTQDAEFEVSTGKTVTVRMMQRTDEGALYSYASTKDLQMLEMPYTHSNGKGLSMVILLPAMNNMSVAEQYLDPEKLSTLEQSASSQRVMVYFPKFKLETEYRLPKVLSAMGMPTAFSDTADFSGMDGRKDLVISEVIHKAYVDVNEEGTEAAAATAVVMKRAMAPQNQQEIPVFRADHPFIFLIRDNDSGAILFAGRVVNPAGS
ncbi:MAG: serpin family protein [Methanoregula sp.]|jgi:serpin B|uniref:serpin family protein n=1 Tax=Methanoregula sp. TaxID=2052170 RepID=UPI0025DB996E|nr:serpin family protein [Methanoregula sp.]MCK9631588.1 serpin family protein [Methanoregula sp.]